MATMTAPEPTIQDILSRAVSATSLERVFLARSRPRGEGVAVSLLASFPADAPPPRAVLESVRRAARGAIECARTLLFVARQGGRRRLDRSDMPCAVPVVFADQRVWG